MSIINATPLLAAAGGDYQISRSVRLRSSASAYLNRTFTSVGTRTTFTYSVWLKRGTLGSIQRFFSDSSNNSYLRFNTGDALDWNFYNGTTSYTITSSQVFRDPSAWYHIMVAVDTTQATSSNRVKFYVNGSQITAFSSASYPAQNNTSNFDNNTAHYISSYSGSAEFFDGYLTEINFIDGQALTPSSFGQYNAYGVWTPTKYNGTYGTNGFYLNFSDNSGATATTIGKDYSGNGNNWTPNNISVTAGVTYDSMTDVPTLTSATAANYAVLNPLDQHGTSAYATVADGNLYWYGSYNTQNGHGIRSTLRVSPTGKWYVEASNITYSGSSNSCMLGFTSSTQPITNSAFGGTLTPWIGVDASVFNNTVSLSSNGASASPSSGTLFASCASGDIINLAIDFDAGKFWVGKNGTWYNSGDPAAGTGATATFSAGTVEWAFWGEYVASSTNGNRSSVRVNFGQQPFSYTPPTGFKALNTQNLTDGNTIKAGNKYFDVHTRSGTGSSTSITGKAFQPDLVWVKSRSAATKHLLTDSVRGATKRLSDGTGTDGTDPEATDTNGLTAFNSDGYTIGSDTNYNNSTGPATYVDWFWKKGATSGFDIVTYTGNYNGSTGTQTIAHSLNAVPKMIIIKNRSSAYDWGVGHASVGWNQAGLLNATNSFGSSSYFNSTAPTSSVFSVGLSNNTNQNLSTHVAYLFSEVAGFSKFGSYTGNGSADGPFVYTGFRPRYVMVKISSGSTGSWWIWDSSRNTYNSAANLLGADSSGAEISPYNCDLLSNGFKIRDATGALNGSTYTFIYAAFAENPFRYALAR